MPDSNDPLRPLFTRATSPYPCDGPDGCGAEPGQPCVYRDTQAIRQSMPSSVGKPRHTMHPSRRRASDDAFNVRHSPPDLGALPLNDQEERLVEELATMKQEVSAVRSVVAAPVQPAPIPNNHPPVVDRLIELLRERKALGVARYGVALQPFNGRDALRDALEEAIDMAAYLMQAIEERDSVARQEEALLRSRLDDLRSKRGQADGETAGEDPNVEVCDQEGS